MVCLSTRAAGHVEGEAFPLTRCKPDALASGTVRSFACASGLCQVSFLAVCSIGRLEICATGGKFAVVWGETAVRRQPGASQERLSGPLRMAYRGCAANGRPWVTVMLSQSGPLSTTPCAGAPERVRV